MLDDDDEDLSPSLEAQKRDRCINSVELSMLAATASTPLLSMNFESRHRVYARRSAQFLASVYNS